MKYYSLIDEDGVARIAVETSEGVLSDLTSVHQELEVLEDLVMAASLSGYSIDEIALQIIEGGAADEYNLDDVLSDESDFALDMPFEPSEVWAAGVTYKTSEMERRRESETPDVYSMVYSAERPEVFFKATPERCVGPDDSVGIREDSNWNVPEPELAFVLYGGEIHRLYHRQRHEQPSDRGREPPIPAASEGVQPLLRDRAVLRFTAESVADPHGLDVSCTITRDGEEVFSGSTNTSQMARTCQELADWLQKHNDVPNMTTVLTGTSIVPPPDFTLQEGDGVTITIEGIGTLVNDVIVV